MGKVLNQVEKTPDPKIIKALEGMLAQAKRGEISDLVMITRVNGQLHSGLLLSQFTNAAMEIIGQMELVKSVIIPHLKTEVVEQREEAEEYEDGDE